MFSASSVPPIFVSIARFRIGPEGSLGEDTLVYVDQRLNAGGRMFLAFYRLIICLYFCIIKAMKKFLLVRNLCLGH